MPSNTGLASRIMHGGLTSADHKAADDLVVAPWPHLSYSTSPRHRKLSTTIKAHDHDKLSSGGSEAGSHIAAIGGASKDKASKLGPGRDNKKADNLIVLSSQDSEAVEFAEPDKRKTKLLMKDRPIIKQWNPVGLLFCLFYCAAALYYFVIRATKTLNIGFTAYGVLVLIIEIISSTATFGYAILLVKCTRPNPNAKGLAVYKTPGKLPDVNDVRFHVRVLIPCYTESVELVQKTVEGALNAVLPAKTLRTVYLCDDSNSPDKAAMIRRLNKEMGTEVVYVSGRPKPKEGQPKETNPKSNNLNNCLKNEIYKEYEPITPGGPKIPAHEVMVVFDADMVADKLFFVKTLEIMAMDEQYALCLTPQGFDNVDPATDMWNRSNKPFWEYMLPGTDALGYIACTGTNFVLRCSALAECGWFPTFSITEDYTLGMLLKAKGYKAGYLNEELAFGESPIGVRNICRQRSRWCKGQMQVLFSWEHTPLFDTSLTLGMRLLYTSVTWSYITNTIAVPVNVLVPFIALVFGVYPLVLNRDFALAATLYYCSSSLVTMYCTDRKHLKPLWFTIVSCHLLWFTFTKATYNVIKSKITGKVTTFKTTTKQEKNDGQQSSDSSSKQQQNKGPGFFSKIIKPQNLGNMEGKLDHYIIFLSFLISFITAVVGVYQMIDRPYTAQGDFRWFLALSIFWSIYNMIPPALFIFYIYDMDHLFGDFCSFCFVLSFLMAVGGIICTWLVPDDYNLGQVLNVSLQFYEAQKSGKLPRISNTPWRGNSAVWDSIILPSGKNYSLVGGWYDDGGMLKLSYTTAFTVSMLSWAYSEFKNGYVSSGNVEFGANTIRWGADYLLKVAATNVTSSAGAVTPVYIAQVGDITKDRAYWGMPEKSTIARPASFLSLAKPGTDNMAMGAAALAAAAVAIQDDSLTVSSQYLQKAIGLYEFAQKTKGLYSKYIESGKLYPSVSMYDDLSYAAVWLYKATGDEHYLNEAVAYYQKTISSEGHVSANPFLFNYENVVPALNLLLYQATKDPVYKTSVQQFVQQWMSTTGSSGDIMYTKKGLAKAQPDGNLQHTANAAFYVMVAAKELMGGKYMLYACWARTQIGYMLGDAGKSYVTGYGAMQPRKTPHKAASCPPPDVADCTWESAYYTTDPNYHTLRGGLVGGPDNDDYWVDDRDQNNPANTVSLVNTAGFSATLAGLVDNDINMAKCQQGNGFIQNIMLKVKKQPDATGQRWWEGV
eukprot:GHRR01010433.1.p1 GENE.GHRR01010433.1~~GHRR01010433.1.p1  ORF type:complete len:1225 (+),score=296.26 GHRR01010433.1:1011-4685(+)